MLPQGLRIMSDKLANFLIQLFAVLMIVSYVFARFLSFHLALALILLFAAGIAAVRFYVRKHFRECVGEPLEERKLPRQFRKYLAENTPAVERLRFRKVGDFLIHPEPLALRARSFLSEGGRCFAYLAQQRNFYFYGFISVFEDGTYLETSPLTPTNNQPDPLSPIRFSFLPKAPVSDLFEFHRAEVARIESLNNTRVLQFAPEQYVEVVRYGHRLTGWDLYKRGKRWTAPPEGLPWETSPASPPAGNPPAAETPRFDEALLASAEQR